MNNSIPTRCSQRRLAWLLVLAAACFTPGNRAHAQQPYYPGAWGSWERREPGEVGMNADRLREAVEYARQAENKASKDLAHVVAMSFSREPFNEILGPTKPRTGGNGMVVRNGYIVAEWGDTRRVDMTFSVTKSYLSTVAGLALDAGLIRDVNDPVRRYARDGKFDGPHNAKITWHHLLQQTSDWSGELWGKPDWADRPEGDDPLRWADRELHEPGTYFKYNDVRVRTCSRIRCSKYGGGRCRSYCASGSWTRSARRRRGAGTATRTPG